MLWKLIGIIAAGLTSLSFIPQVIKMFKTKSAQDVSLITLIQLACGVSLWIIYGAYLKNIIIIAANAITLLTLLAALFLYYLYAPGKS